MSSPLPKLPDNPLGDLPDNPLGAPPRPPLIGSREPLRLPIGRKFRRAPRSPLPSLTRPQGHQTAQKPPVVQVITQPPPAAPAASQSGMLPVRAHGKRATAAQEREGTRTFLGDRLGGSVNRLPRDSRERLRSLLRDHGREYHAGYHEAGERYLADQLAQRREGRKHEAKYEALRAARQREELRRAAAVQRNDLGDPPDAPGGQR